jgi:O-antigen biosynthesis protein WbqP
MFYRHAIRPIIDRITAFAALVMLSPIMVIVALLIVLEDRGPVFFRQKRNGARNVPFEIIKFRSMPVGTPHLPSADARDLKPTRTGKVIRRLNIDEVPQFWNVLKGEMALIGPRPSLLSQKDVISLRTASGAHNLRPGITGLAQIRGYDRMSAEEKCAYDRIYSEGIGPILDLKILLGPIAYLIRSQPVV